MFARLSAFVIWSLVAATAMFWALRFTASPPRAPAYAVPVDRSMPAHGDLARLLGAPLVAAANEARPEAASPLSPARRDGAEGESARASRRTTASRSSPSTASRPRPSASARVSKTAWCCSRSECAPHRSARPRASAACCSSCRPCRRRRPASCRRPERRRRRPCRLASCRACPFPSPGADRRHAGADLVPDTVCAAGRRTRAAQPRPACARGHALAVALAALLAENSRYAGLAVSSTQG